MPLQLYYGSCRSFGCKCMFPAQPVCRRAICVVYMHMNVCARCKLLLFFLDELALFIMHQALSFRFHALCLFCLKTKFITEWRARGVSPLGRPHAMRQFFKSKSALLVFFCAAQATAAREFYTRRKTHFKIKHETSSIFSTCCHCTIFV